MDISSGVCMCADKGKLGRRKEGVGVRQTAHSLLILSCSHSHSSFLLHLHFFLLLSSFSTLGWRFSGDLQILGVFFISLELHHLRQVLLHFLLMGCSSISFFSSPFHYKKASIVNIVIFP